MPARPENGDWRSDHGAQNTLPSTMYSQPWWQTVSNSASSGENASELSAQEHRSGSQTNGAAQHQDGSKAQEHSLKMAQSSTPAAIGGCLEPNSNMELVGHSIVLSYPFSEQQYSGLLTSYGPQTLVTPQLYAMHHSRMPLPLEMEDEPVYVNAKQFHGIMRRRQARAKAELAKKAIKARKPYLHESRHRHAMRRARGCGGRFLSTKHQDNGAVNAVSDKSVNSTANLSRQSASLSGPEQFVTGTGGTSASNDQQEQKRSMVHEIEAQIPPNGNNNGHELSSTNQLSSSDGMKGGFMGLRKENARVNGVSNRAQPMN